MKRIIFLITALCFLYQMNAQNKNANLVKAQALIKQMTLEEKVGQMTQVTFAVIAKGGWGDQESICMFLILKDHVR